MRSALCGLCLLLVIAAGSAVAQDEADQKFSDKVTFYGDDGKLQTAEEVRVDEATYDEVKYTLRGGRTTVTKKGFEVVRINYGDAPRVYLTGLQFLTRQQYSSAASDFAGAKNAVDAGQARDWLLEYTAVKGGQALLALGRKESSRLSEAVESFKDALEANAKTLLFDQVQLGLVECYILQEKWADAKAAAEKLGEVAGGIKHHLWEAGAKQAEARLLMAQGEFTQAVNAYQSLVSLAQREARLAKVAILKNRLLDLEAQAAVEQGWARVAWAESSGSKTDWDAARNYFQSLSTGYAGSEREASRELVAAAVLNGKGRCLMDEDPRRALKLFAEAEVVHFTARAEVARALYLKALAYEKIGGSHNRKMADLARKELKEFYGDSVWARK